jgi:sodium/potassium-transporting ATPase subunit alpha
MMKTTPDSSTNDDKNFEDVDIEAPPYGKEQLKEQAASKENPMYIEEPYMELKELAERHSKSNINISNIEKTGGLSSEDAKERLKTYGENVLTPPPKMPEWKRFLLQFTNMFMILLNTCAVLSLIAFFLEKDKQDHTNLYLAAVLFAVVFLTCFMQFHEEGKAYKVMDSFSKMLAKECKVVRDGKQQDVPTKDLVIGDIVLIKDGDKVPADMVLLLCRGLKAECSSLTGESEPVICSDRASSKGTRIFECKNLVFSSSLCFDGMAIGVVVRTGDNTVSSTWVSKCPSSFMH